MKARLPQDPAPAGKEARVGDDVAEIAILFNPPYVSGARGWIPID